MITNVWTNETIEIHQGSVKENIYIRWCKTYLEKYLVRQ